MQIRMNIIDEQEKIEDEFDLYSLIYKLIFNLCKEPNNFQFDVSINPNMQNKMFKSGKIK